MLFSKAKRGAIGNATTNMVANPYWITAEDRVEMIFMIFKTFAIIRYFDPLGRGQD